MRILEGFRANVEKLAFSPDARSLVVTGFNAGFRADLWDVPDGKEPRHRLPHVQEALYTPDGTELLTLNRAPDRSPSVRRICLETMEPVGKSVTSSSGYDLMYLRLSPDASRMAAIWGWRELLWWSWPDLEPLPAWTREELIPGEWWQPGPFAFSPSGEAVAVFSPVRGSVAFHETATGTRLWETRVRTKQDHVHIVCSPDGRYVAAASGNELAVLSASTGEVVGRLSQPRKYFLDLAFTPDGRFLATVSKEETVKFFDTASWRLHTALAWQVGGLRAVAFSKDGMLAAAGGTGKKVVVWDVDL